MALKPEPTAPFHSVRYVLRVLEAVSKYGGAGVTDVQIARESGLPSGHLTPLLSMLRREGYVERVADGAYVIGDSLALLGSGHARRQALEARLQESLYELRDSVGAAVYLSRYIDGEIKVTQIADGPLTPAVNEWVDFRSTAHASAIGKCLLTQLDRNGRREHLARHKIARFTSRTITSERLLFSRLDSRPPTVPVLDLQEYAVGTVCAAVPLTAGSTVGCLALSLPVEYAHRLRSAAETLNRRAAPMALSLTIQG
ncbi:IclR family transcriptional regulator C-terminal domain-containing protein [Streptomyces sp. MnatMP-M17]|uniref:IclR family transcriptional regulator n=1 Tax=unclassified Streptomyces TaxID=2593676 RepID=UPI00081F6427|nr:IclR family transcriptional regulator C-terminal domain-containing protein [Streptomyces sp. MnatMP-M17]MYZ37819.1 IclR family transcriptional regulator [Streptomyces sp. SID4917]SCF94368.1 transcriptional regulator, IclR family [Streptomyces sp. MnatMP-M17]